MKAATGELNLTVITIVAIAGIIAFFTYTMWPRIQETIDNQWSNISEDSQGYTDQTRTRQD